MLLLPLQSSFSSSLPDTLVTVSIMTRITIIVIITIVITIMPAITAAYHHEHLPRTLLLLFYLE